MEGGGTFRAIQQRPECHPEGRAVLLRLADDGPGSFWGF
jgi:hypothetical protein